MRTLFSLVLGLVLIAATSGCYGYYGYDVPVVEVTSAPVEPVTQGPYVMYAGHPTYWHHGHWYYEDRGRWYRYHHEPAELHAYRHHHYYYP
jgi:hypothetical protein